MGSQLIIDSDVCSGHGRCYSLFPQYFDADNDGFGAVVDGATPDEETAARVVACCPERAISLR